MFCELFGSSMTSLLAGLKIDTRLKTVCFLFSAYKDFLMNLNTPTHEKGKTRDHKRYRKE